MLRCTALYMRFSTTPSAAHNTRAQRDGRVGWVVRVKTTAAAGATSFAGHTWMMPHVRRQATKSVCVAVSAGRRKHGRSKMDVFFFFFFFLSGVEHPSTKNARHIFFFFFPKGDDDERRVYRGDGSVSRSRALSTSFSF